MHERARKTLELIGIVNDFLNRIQYVWENRERIDKSDYMKFKSFCTTKEMVTKLKRPSTEWEKIFVSYTSDKGLITRINKELLKTHDPVKKWTNELNRGCSKEELHMSKNT
jgi:hypothetical protein